MNPSGQPCVEVGCLRTDFLVDTSLKDHLGPCTTDPRRTVSDAEREHSHYRERTAVDPCKCVPVEFVGRQVFCLRCGASLGGLV